MSVVGYWDIRGLAQPIRLLLSYAGEKFENKLYESAPDYTNPKWFKEDKADGLGMDFPNLPYYFDGQSQRRISQSSAIIRYLARKHNLDGDTEDEKVRADLAYFEAVDLRTRLIDICFGPDFEGQIAAFDKELPGKLGRLEKFLGDNAWVAGSKVTFADFIVYEVIDVIKTYKNVLLSPCPKLSAYLTRFRELPAIKAYMESDKFMSRPIMGPVSKWDN